MEFYYLPEEHRATHAACFELTCYFLRITEKAHC